WAINPATSSGMDASSARICIKEFLCNRPRLSPPCAPGPAPTCPDCTGALHPAASGGKVPAKRPGTDCMSVQVKTELPQDSSPILAEVVRGQMVESRHHASVAVVDAHGGIVRAWGDVELPIYGRSAIKPLLAIPLVESGAADRFKLGTAEIALATASHNSEPRHVETVTSWLHRIGLGVEDLECGAHWPSHEATMQAMLRARSEPTRAHNNCSGKHAGFLST